MKRSGRAGARFALILRMLAATGLFVALAVGLLVAVNVWSFGQYERFDWTGRKFGPSVRTLGHFPYLDMSLLKPSGRFPQQFTLPDDLTTELRKLREPTTVVVYQRHKS